MKSLILALGLLMSSQAFAKEVTIYSVYPAEEISAIFTPFTERTGIKVNIQTGTTDELQNKLLNERNDTTADLYLDKDITFLAAAKKADLFQSFTSKTVKANVPTHLRESTDLFTLVFYRARVIMYNPNKVNPSELSTYEDLGNAKWKNRLCVRTSTNSYNQALGGYLVKHLGETKTAEVVKNWVQNFSVEPIKNDRGVIQALADGQCDVGLANTYYLPAFIRANPEFPVKVYFPNQKSFGTHINGVGIGIVKHAKNVNEANLLLEYFTSVEVQEAVAAAFSQYPVNKKANMTTILESFGAFNEDTSDLSQTTEAISKANEIFKNVQYK